MLRVAETSCKGYFRDVYELFFGQPYATSAGTKFEAGSVFTVMEVTSSPALSTCLYSTGIIERLSYYIHSGFLNSSVYLQHQEVGDDYLLVKWNTLFIE